MKKLALCLMAALMMLAIVPSNLTAGTDTHKVAVSTPVKTIDSAKENVLTARLDEIKAMDLSTLNSVQKRELRREVRSINGTLNQMGSGVIYISAGGLLLVVLLVIILL